MGDIIINDIILTDLNIIPNSNGNIFHIMKNIDVGFSKFGEAYFSTILKGKIKAWKQHSLMTLNIVCPIGRIKFVLIDDRPNSSSFNTIQEIELSDNLNYKRLTIPPNIWFGFQGLDEFNILLNIADIVHDPNEQINIPISEFSNKYKW